MYGECERLVMVQDVAQSPAKSEVISADKTFSDDEEEWAPCGHFKLTRPKAASRPAAMQMIQFLNEARTEAHALQAVGEEVRATGEWEPCEVVMDSGAFVSVGPRSLGVKAGYAVEESPGSKAGTSYTSASGGELPNLGQRFMAVLTEEGTVRGMEQQVCDVTRPLEAIRANVKAGHAILFDDDGSGQGTGSYMVNKSTGEINMIRDDGANYLMRRWIIPPQEVPALLQRQAEGFQWPSN